jgi:predicted transcriptional regulator
MKVKQTVIIPEKDLKKIMKNKGVSSIRQLAKVAGVEYTYLAKCVNGRLVMSEKTWNILKQSL